MSKNFNSSDEWHINKIVIKKNYIWTLIDSKTRFIIDWFLISSRQAVSAFHLFTKTKDKFVNSSKIVSDRLSSYTIHAKVIF
ncbi:DDE-type integrase/transposase/recombinase [Fusobacterium varium]|uniref:DDE-type integrase/transposase/recombinase n=1 Tax=Fusobacterium varium TaxID=856 RepID=UPI00242B1853|nr:DDE-type integrase/transposase/recombinase [Fusobacterium varium]